MKKVLFINGCLREDQSRTLTLAQTYLDTLTTQGDVEIIHRTLSDESLTFLSSSNFDKETGSLTLGHDCALAKEFASVDEIVLAAPFWEFMFPAMVSCYLEQVSVVGITFHYTDKGSAGLCKANTFTYIYTSGESLNPEDTISEAYLERLSKLYGIPNFSAFSAQGLDIQTNCAETILADACQKIKQMASL